MLHAQQANAPNVESWSRLPSWRASHHRTKSACSRSCCWGATHLAHIQPTSHRLSPRTHWSPVVARRGAPAAASRRGPPDTHPPADLPRPAERRLLLLARLAQVRPQAAIGHCEGPARKAAAPPRGLKPWGRPGPAKAGPGRALLRAEGCGARTRARDASWSAHHPNHTLTHTHTRTLRIRQ